MTQRVNCASVDAPLAGRRLMLVFPDRLPFVAPRRGRSTLADNNFNLDNAIAQLDAAGANSGGHCAQAIGLALEAGGLDISSRPLNAKAYGPFLISRGFAKIVEDAQYSPLKGDIVVIQNYENGNPAGHIAMFDGSIWVSDFTQTDMWGGPGYRKNKPSHEIYRYSPPKKAEAAK